MKTLKNIIWGLVFIFGGIILGLNSLNIIKFDIFFDGWWTLFIIIPSFTGLITDEDKTGSVIGLIIGILLLLGCQDFIGFEIVGKLAVPIVLVVIGLSLLFKSTLNNKINESIKKVNTKSKAEYSAIFAGQDVKIDDEFKGSTLTAVFGGISLDLRKAKIEEDIVIDSKAIFGGIDIYVPQNVKVQIKSNSIFGGVENKTNSKDGKITIYVDATCVFGGVDIK